MAFITDKEKLKSGLLIFRGGDVAPRNYYCRNKLPNEDRYKAIALWPASRSATRAGWRRGTMPICRRSEVNHLSIVIAAIDSARR